MGCTKCKEKKTTKKLLYEATGNNDSKIIIFIIIWSLFAIYGIISFINLFL